jgi:uncharacterized protein with HEPN domain
MRDAAKEAMAFVSGRTRSDLKHDRQLLLALVKSIEIVGEAASQVTEGTRGRIAGIPWPAIIAMRHRLVHAYFDVDADRVWDTVADDLPPLIEALDEALGV